MISQYSTTKIRELCKTPVIANVMSVMWQSPTLWGSPHPETTGLAMTILNV